MAVKIRYHANEYHNIYHAVDVLQATYFIICPELTMTQGGHGHCPDVMHEMLRDPGFASFTSFEIFATLVAAFGHDIGHPGCNNFFMNNARTSLAMMYHGESVLEHYHVTLLFDLLQKNPILQNITPDLQKSTLMSLPITND